VVRLQHDKLYSKGWVAIMEKIGLMRKEIGMSQTELARKSGIDRTNLCKIEKGNFLPTLRTLSKIAAALNCKVSDLVD
jgi:UDPglucose 6-dehydrogenase